MNEQTCRADIRGARAGGECIQDRSHLGAVRDLYLGRWGQPPSSKGHLQVDFRMINIFWELNALCRLGLSAVSCLVAH